MENSKTTELIASLNLHEVKAFQSYLSSPYFTSDKNLMSTFDFLRNFIINKESFSRREVHSKIFANKKFNDQQVRYLLTDLSQHIEYFLALRTLDKNKMLFRNLSVKALSQHDCEKAYNYHYNSINGEQKFSNANFYYHLFDVAENHLVYSAKKQSGKRQFDYTEVLSNLEVFYLAKKLQLFCEVINLKIF